MRRNGYYQNSKGLYVPSVSIVKNSAGNSGVLVQWAAKQGALGVYSSSPKTVEEAAEIGVAYLQKESGRVQDFGTRVHSGIEKYLAHQDVEWDDWTEDERTALQTFIKFQNDIKFKTVFIEKSFVSEYGFGGRTDLVSELSPEQIGLITPFLAPSSAVPVPGSVIIDYKTGNFYKKPHLVQLAAYRQGIKEQTGVDCNGGMVFNIKRDNPEKILVYYFAKEELEDAFVNGFLPAHKVWSYFDAPQWYHKQEAK